MTVSTSFSMAPVGRGGGRIVRIRRPNCKYATILVQGMSKRQHAGRSLFHGRRFDEPADDVVGLHTVGFGVEIGDEPMAQDRRRDSTDVFRRDIRPAVKE